MSRLSLNLVSVPNVLGIYGATKDVFPAKMARLHPDAAAAFLAAEKGLGVRLRVSDMFRTAEQSLQARAQKAGVQPPGWSLHNYGVAIDIDTDAMLKSTKLAKPALDKEMEKYGWFCHRKDGKRGMEDWHYNYFGVGEAAAPFLKACASSTNTSAGGDAKILSLYKDALTLDAKEVQECLAHLKLYSGEIDGAIGPRSKEALMAFQRTWKLQPSGQVDKKTERTLAYVSADIPKMG
jgi:hypothetical protein